MTYLWLKTFHVLAVITWMAGAFYIFRIVAYHTKHREQRETAAVFREMERKMLLIVMRPGAAVTVALGIAMLVSKPELLAHRWMHVKLAAVLGMLAFHGYAEWAAAHVARDQYVLTERRARLLHIVPTVLLGLIVAMVIVKPF
ncbi:MAG TPA: CopD family protein [Gemmatimonadaceae bacterium]|nr:CopD family protein [Gemmatimonadaceae bacterium]